MTEHTSPQKVDMFCRTSCYASKLFSREVVSLLWLMTRSSLPSGDQMLTMGLPEESIDASVSSERHDHIYTTYL